ncbi:MAG: hypothetical protein R2698_02295 [Microthrixaceae bacterium]
MARSLLADLLGPEDDHDGWPPDQQRAFGAIVAALDRLSGIDDLDPTFDPARFDRALAVELDGPMARLGRVGCGVTVASLSNAAGHDLDAVFVLGAAEGSLPVLGTDDTLVGDRIRGEGHEGLLVRRARMAEQHRQFLAALARRPPRVRPRSRAVRIAVWSPRPAATSAPRVDRPARDGCSTCPVSGSTISHRTARPSSSTSARSPSPSVTPPPSATW